MSKDNLLIISVIVEHRITHGLLKNFSRDIKTKAVRCFDVPNIIIKVKCVV